MQVNQIKLKSEKKDISLEEEFMEVDYLKQFKRHLPSLKTKLSRLKMLPIPDPLFKHDDISEDMILRCCEPLEIPPNMLIGNNWSSTISLEEFSKEKLKYKELELPNILETCASEQKDRTGFSDICDILMIKPEQTDEQNSITNQDICQVEMYGQQTVESMLEGFADAGSTEQMKTLVDMEVDLTLSPIHKDSNNFCLSTPTLFEEPFSPQGHISLGSVKDQRELEMVLWTSEKHPSFALVDLMLREPQSYEPPVDFQPLSEALGFFKSEKLIFNDEPTVAAEFLPTPLCNSCDFIESITSDVLPSKTDFEEFKKMCPEQDFSIPSIPNTLLSNLKTPEEPTLDPVSNHSKPNKIEPPINYHLQRQNLNCGQTNFKQTVSVTTHSNGCQNTKEKNLSQPVQQTLLVRKNSPKSFRENQRCKGIDLLSAFIVLRCQKPPSVTTSPSPSCAVNSDVTKHVFCNEPQTTDQGHRIERLYGAVSGNAFREQGKAVSKCMSPFVCPSNETQQRQDIIVVQVKATEFQYHAYCELVSFAQPYMSFVQKLGLDMKVWGDFRCLTMDQIQFLVKQQRKSLSGASSHKDDLAKVEELFCQLTLVHVLVSFKELLVKCSLSTGVEFLQEKNENRLKQLLKRLQIILYLSQKKQKTNPKLLELQKLLTTWFNKRTANTTAEKILVLFTYNLDNTRSIILGCLHQLFGAAAVADLHPEEGKIKLNGATIVSSMCNRACALVCEQHVGPDFPWQCFSRLVEYDHPGPSPWGSVCSEKNLIHASFNTVIPDNDISPRSWENCVPHVLFVTDGFLKCPVLLQTLESTFNITVMERNHSMTLQTLGGTHLYAVITVDENTAIVIQKQEELCQERSSEGLVMRLNVLSLQYSCCWLVLHCPDTRGGGLSNEAFSNLTHVYSSLVIFGMKSENFDVKVLMVSDVLEMAKWISQICLYTLMSSERDPVGYLDREWLAPLESNEENCLSQFPCINPMVSQLMLRRAPNLPWLLNASLPELKEMLPEVPDKVLKLFNDTTSLYSHSSDINKSDITAVVGHSVQVNTPNNSAWINGVDQKSLILSPVQDLRFPFGVQDSFHNTASTEEPDPDVRFKLSSFLEPDVDKQKSWTISDLWKDNRDEMKASDWGIRSGAIGKIVGRADLRLPQHTSCIATHQVKYSSPFKAESKFNYNEVQQYRTVPPGGEVAEWSPELSPNFSFLRKEGLTSTLAAYGSKSLLGQERKRGGDADTLLGRVLIPQKRSRLSFEKVPGRSDGQTRLKLF
ncbi:hypothetical protein WMY93_005233 [Mugilogobius chulae]|uniref:Protein shortage in chiasmata 1 ortholog n=1 Tax=Mugilogobius chulae TaxID=88201 RepID=A0AAW0PQH5_9GOBI